MRRSTLFGLALALWAVGSTVLASDAEPQWQRAETRGQNVVRRAPVLGPSAQLGPERGIAAEGRGGERTSNWTLIYTAANRVFQDIDFADTQTGYIAGELGIVYKTTNGGAQWTQNMSLGYPYYWYGVEALSPNSVVISGFQNQTGEGIVRWTQDGGATWGSTLTVDPTAWLDKIRFGDAQHGLASTIAGGDVVCTSNGGLTAPDWTRVAADPGNWFAGNFTFLADRRVFLTGIHFCRSTDGGASWAVLPSADQVFDGAAEFLDPSLGFTGGGSISPQAQGWVHRTTNGGDSWTGRLLTTPYPIRTVRFATAQRGWAAGGNIYSGGGGIWGTTDGGNTWNLEMDTGGAEMRGIAISRVSADSVDVWSCGYTSGFQGRVYKRRVAAPGGVSGVIERAGGQVGPIRSFPNPFSPSTTLSFDIAHAESVLVDIYDPTGRIIRRIRPGLLGSGTHQIRWDGRDESGRRLSSGVFFYRLRAGDEVDGGTLVLVR